MFRWSHWEEADAIFGSCGSDRGRRSRRRATKERCCCCPYPTDEDKEMLREQTGLSIGQISNWMANTRRRQKARPKRSASPSIRPSTKAINIPVGRTWESLSTYPKSQFGKADKFMATVIAGKFLTFRVRNGYRDGIANSLGGASTEVPAVHQQNHLG
jgi:hypothetical protein